MQRNGRRPRPHKHVVRATLVVLLLGLAPLTWAQSSSPPAGPHGTVELPEQRTATSKTFKHADGRITKRLFAGPVHFRNGGRWQEIDASLIPTASGERDQGYAWRTRSNGFGVLLRPQLERDYLRFDIARQPFGFELDGARPVSADVKGARVEYAGALPGVDLRYEMRPEGVKEELVLRDRDAATRFQFTITPPDKLRTTASRRPDGSVVLYTGGRGRPSFALEPPFATDAADGARRAGAATRRQGRDVARHVSMEVEEVDGRFQVELTVDEAWLRDPARRFPVTVDPTITVQPTSKSAEFVGSCPGCSGLDWGSVWIGTDDIDSYRGAFQFDLGDIPPGAAVSSASFGLYNQADWCVYTSEDPCGAKAHQLDVHRITSSWTANTLTRNLLFQTPALGSYSLPVGAGDQWMTWGVTSTVQAWVAGTQANYGLMVKRATEPLDVGGPEVPGGTFVDGDASLRPRLDVTYASDAVRFHKPETLHGNGADLQWERFDGSTGNAFSAYEVHRSATTGFTPSASTRLATIGDASVTSYRDTTAAPNKAFSYKIVTNGKPSVEQRVTLPAAGQARKVLQPGAADGKVTYVDDIDGPATCGNWGSDTYLYTGSDTWRERPLLSFDLRDVPAGASITGATLSLWMHEQPTAAMTVGAYRMTSGWTEGSGLGDCTGDGASWAERTGSVRWATPGGDHVATPTATKAHTASDARGWDAFDITSMVQSWVSGGAPNHGVMLRATDETDDLGKYLAYWSDDFGANPARRPKLAVTYADGSQVIGPTVALAAPAGNAMLSGTVRVEAAASDDRRVDKVEFLVDGAVKATLTAAPWTWDWSTGTVANGTHSLSVRATDDAGNVTTSAERTVDVGNSAPPSTRVTFPSGSYDDVVKAGAPAAYWRLGEPTGTAAADASGNGRGATYAGTFALGQAGLLSGSADPAAKLVNGTTDGSLTSTALGGLLGGSMTAEAWASSAGPAGAGTFNRLVSRGWGSAGGWLLAQEKTTAGEQRARFSINAGGTVYTASAPLAPGRHHLAGSYDGTTVRLFTDGAQVATAAVSGAALGTTASVVVGGTLDTDVTVDEVAVYGRAVDPSHLRAHADVGAGRPATVQGETAVEAAAADDGSVKRVEFYVDGNRFAEDTAAPYAATLPTLGADPVYDDAHEVTTKAYDDHGQVTTSAPTQIAVTNTAGTKYDAAFQTTAPPPAVTFDPAAAAQDKHGIEVTVTNTSGQTWDAANVVLKSRWIPPDAGAAPIVGAETALVTSLPPGQAKKVQVDVQAPPLPAGVDKAKYTLQVDAYDKANGQFFADKGNKPVENPVIVNKALLTGLGLEKYYQYDGEELGAGMNHLVNVANGNSIVRWTPLSSPGRGLATVLDLTYNSLEKKSESPVGNNFSVALSGLSRLGNPIDIHPNKADEIAGRANKFVELTDGDGTTHRFEGRQAADGSTYWEEPEGVHLYLRSLGGTDPARRWAFTRPDRVTFYYDADGYPTSVEDANGNRLTYTLQDTPPAEDPGGPKRRVTRVTDAGGRSYDIAYYSKDDAKKPQIRGKIRRITDHTGSAVDFEYYEDGNLLRLIQRGGAGADGSFLPDRAFVFTYTTSNGEGPALTAAERINPDPKTPNQSTRLFSVRDPRGKESTFAYLGSGYGNDRWKIASRTDRAAATTTFGYDTVNRVTTSTAPLARVSKYGYDVEGKVTSIVNPENQTTTVAWTADRHVERVTEPNGKFTRYAYNANGYLVDEWDQLGRQSHLEYQNLAADAGDVAGRWRADRGIPHISQLVLRRTPRGKEWRFGYDENGNPLNRGNMTSVRDPEGGITRHDYNLDGTLRRTTDPNGHVTRFPAYDLNGLMTETVQEMDANTSATGPDDRVTRFEHDADGLLLWVQDALHRDETGPDPRQYRTYFDYDSFHRMGRQSTPKSTRFERGTLIWSAAEFDPNDNVVRKLGAHYGEQYAPAKSSLAERSYDAMDRLTESVRPHAASAPAGDLERTRVDYDSAGRKTRVTSPRGVATATSDRDFAVIYDYDRLDRVIRSTREGDRGDSVQQTRTTHFCFDAVGDLRSVTAPRAQLPTVTCGSAGAPAGTAFTSRIDYNAAHEVTVRTNPNGHTFKFGYDLDGNVETIEDQQGTVERREYDGRDKVVKVIQPFEGGTTPRSVTTKLEYDAAGNLKRTVSPRGWDKSSDKQTFTDYVTTYEYDAADELIRTVLPKDAGTTQAYEHRRYDANGNLRLSTLASEAATLEGVDADDKSEMTHFDPGWVRTSDDQNPQIAYDYRAEGWQSKRVPSDDEGNKREDRASRTEYFDDGTRQFQFDRGGRPTEFRYDANNNLIFALDKGVEDGRQKPVETTLTYNGFDEVATTVQRQEGQDSRHATLVHDPNGNVWKRSDDRQEGEDPKEPRRHEFTYDPADRMTLHEDFGRKPDTSDDRRITSTYVPTGWKETRAVLENVAGTFKTKTTMRWEYFLNGKIRTQTTRSHDRNGAEQVTESHRLEYIDAGVYVNGHRVVDEFMRRSPKASANCRTSTCRATYRYDARDRLVEERNTKGDGTAINYTLDAASNISRQTGGPNGTVTAEHAGGQIESQTIFGHTSHYHYDDFGNLDCVTARDDGVAVRGRPGRSARRRRRAGLHLRPQRRPARLRQLDRRGQVGRLRQRRARPARRGGLQGRGRPAEDQDLQLRRPHERGLRGGAVPRRQPGRDAREAALVLVRRRRRAGRDDL